MILLVSDLQRPDSFLKDLLLYPPWFLRFRVLFVKNDFRAYFFISVKFRVLNKLLK